MCVLSVNFDGLFEQCCFLAILQMWNLNNMEMNNMENSQNLTENATKM